MRIAMLCIHSSPLGQAGSKDTGGMSTYLRGLSSALGRRGHRVDLFTRMANSGKEEVRQMGPNVRLICPGDGLGELDKHSLYPHCPTVAESIDQFSRREKGGYDYIFSHYWLSGVTGRILKERWKIPHLLMFHTLGRAKNETCPGENEPYLRLQTEAELALECDLVVAAAKQEKERLVEYFNLSPEKVALIPCGIDRDLFYPFDSRKRRDAKLKVGVRPEGKIVLAVGRVEPVKGFDTFINAASLLPFEDNFELIIVGGDDKSSALIAALKEKTLELGLNRRVRFTGVVEHSLLPVYYNAADVTVLPSYYESFGLTALESVACGTPVAASPVGILPELIGQNRRFGILLKERAPAAWAAAIRRAYTAMDPISKAALATGLTPYSWPEAAASLESTLSSL